MAPVDGLGYGEIVPINKGGYNNTGLFLVPQKATVQNFVLFYRWEELNKQVHYLLYYVWYTFKLWLINFKSIICKQFSH